MVEQVSREVTVIHSVTRCEKEKSLVSTKDFKAVPPSALQAGKKKTDSKKDDAKEEEPKKATKEKAKKKEPEEVVNF